MQQPLIRLREVLEKTTIEYKNQPGKETNHSASDLQFSFNGFVNDKDYKIHLRQFYDQFKADLETTIWNTAEIVSCFALLETILILLIECEMLDYSFSINEILLDFQLFSENDVRMEAEFESHLGKK